MKKKSKRGFPGWAMPSTPWKRNSGMLLEPKTGIIYGPVHSRRLGRSLGINILPAKTKACPFDCGSPEVFRRYNQPCSGIDLEKITRGLAELEDVIIQAVQLYTLDRAKNLSRIKDQVKKTGLLAEIF